MVKIVGTFIKEMPSSIQEKAKEILVFCKNNVIKFKRKKSRRKRD